MYDVVYMIIYFHSSISALSCLSLWYVGILGIYILSKQFKVNFPLHLFCYKKIFFKEFQNIVILFFVLNQ